MKSRIEERPEGLCIVIPARRQTYMLFVLPVWLVFWALGEGAALRGLLNRDESTAIPNAFWIVWLVPWTLGGIQTLVTWLWMVAGQERIVLGPYLLSHRYELFGVGRTREFALTDIRGLHVSSEPKREWPRRPRVFTGGVIVLESKARPFRFGAGIDIAEGRMIVERLKERYGFPA